MSYLEELLPKFRKGAKIRRKDWDNQSYYYYEKNFIWNQDIELVSFDSKDVMADDWDYIIKNKCLCEFWDNDNGRTLGLLREFIAADNLFCMLLGGSWNYCRPVCRDEVAFYEDKE